MYPDFLYSSKESQYPKLGSITTTIYYLYFIQICDQSVTLNEVIHWVKFSYFTLLNHSRTILYLKCLVPNQCLFTFEIILLYFWKRFKFDSIRSIRYTINIRSIRFKFEHGSNNTSLRYLIYSSPNKKMFIIFLPKIMNCRWIAHKKGIFFNISKVCPFYTNYVVYAYKKVRILFFQNECTFFA